MLDRGDISARGRMTGDPEVTRISAYRSRQQAKRGDVRIGDHTTGTRNADVNRASMSDSGCNLELRSEPTENVSFTTPQVSAGLAMICLSL
jgi:hypothetical protein